ncbi:BspA family leucine-rich repeat surface protein [Vibrio sp. 1CM23M]|uniref:BspA family leucine-rich repeat surface protein n=1 Tax=Vibrio sp. 1CM23M TaxID=2929164 RepID=UPI0020BF13F3|nr:BspA family leucine-rich repeat surface protein [Vibrio sp. 1CM23M]MCK8072429.1 BspA family leucine-rich repeat surface protein [Vibrio sp. 1CM23M]
MKKTIIALSMLVSMSAMADFVALVGDNSIRYNVKSADPEGESGLIIGGGEYVDYEVSGSTPPTPTCIGSELSRDELINKINADEDVTNACVGTITDFTYLFLSNPSFNQDISNWDVSNVTTFYHTFSYVTGFDQDISNWDMSSAEDLTGMFYGSNFNNNNQPLNWNVSNVKTFDNMFNANSKFNQNISSWNISSATNLREMFMFATSFDQDISGWDITNVTNLTNFVADAGVFKQDLSGWDVSGKSVTGFADGTLMDLTDLPTGVVKRY